jgi:hypothetical protein
MPIIAALCLWNATVLNAQNAITYGNIHGRFGDALVAYMRAKWISYRYQWPLLYRPFPYSEQLMMHIAESPYDPHAADFSRQVFIDNLDVLEKDDNDGEDTLYELPYFSENFLEYLDFDYFQRCAWFQVDWEDPTFRALVRSQIAPVESVSLAPLPEDCLNVAIHVRLGGSFDKLTDIMALFPLKAPPLDWYCEQLAYISQLYRHPKMYVYIFTDDEHPEQLLEYFEQHMQAEHMQFDCRRQDNRHDANVVEDLLYMARFECLIRPMSNFSFVAGVIGKAKMIIYPTSYRRQGATSVITARKVEQRPYDAMTR